MVEPNAINALKNSAAVFESLGDNAVINIKKEAFWSNHTVTVKSDEAREEFLNTTLAMMHDEKYGLNDRQLTFVEREFGKLRNQEEPITGHQIARIYNKAIEFAELNELKNFKTECVNNAVQTLSGLCGIDSAFVKSEVDFSALESKLLEIASEASEKVNRIADPNANAVEQEKFDAESVQSKMRDETQKFVEEKATTYNKIFSLKGLSQRNKIEILSDVFSDYGFQKSADFDAIVRIAESGKFEVALAKLQHANNAGELMDSLRALSKEIDQAIEEQIPQKQENEDDQIKENRERWEKDPGIKDFYKRYVMEIMLAGHPEALKALRALPNKEKVQFLDTAMKIADEGVKTIGLEEDDKVRNERLNDIKNSGLAEALMDFAKRLSPDEDTDFSDVFKNVKVPFPSFYDRMIKSMCAQIAKEYGLRPYELAIDGKDSRDTICEAIQKEQLGFKDIERLGEIFKEEIQKIAIRKANTALCDKVYKEYLPIPDGTQNLFEPYPETLRAKFNEMVQKDPSLAVINFDKFNLVSCAFVGPSIDAAIKELRLKAHDRLTQEDVIAAIDRGFENGIRALKARFDEIDSWPGFDAGRKEEMKQISTILGIEDVATLKVLGGASSRDYEVFVRSLFLSIEASKNVANTLRKIAKMMRKTTSDRKIDISGGKNSTFKLALMYTVLRSMRLNEAELQALIDAMDSVEAKDSKFVFQRMAIESEDEEIQIRTEEALLAADLIGVIREMASFLLTGNAPVSLVFGEDHPLSEIPRGPDGVYREMVENDSEIDDDTRKALLTIGKTETKFSEEEFNIAQTILTGVIEANGKNAHLDTVLNLMAGSLPELIAAYRKNGNQELSNEQICEALFGSKVSHQESLVDMVCDMASRKLGIREPEELDHLARNGAGLKFSTLIAMRTSEKPVVLSNVPFSLLGDTWDDIGSKELFGWDESIKKLNSHTVITCTQTNGQIGIYQAPAVPSIPVFGCCKTDAQTVRLAGCLAPSAMDTILNLMHIYPQAQNLSKPLALDIAITSEGDDVRVQFKTQKSSPIQMTYACVIKPDGKLESKDLTLSKK